MMALMPLAAPLAALVPSAAPTKFISLDQAWRFTLGDDGAYSEPAHDDGSWRLLDVPHDWSIEDLAPRSSTNDVLEIRNGTWLFMRGGQNASWEQPDLDEGGWAPIKVPSDWRDAANYTEADAYGWYRRHVDASAAQVASSSLLLALGAVSKADVTYLNGVKIGESGNTHPDCSDYLRYRSYPIPAGLLKPTGNVVAVRVYSEGAEWPGGLFDHPVLRNADQRTGAFDPALSAGGRATGYTVGGVGWYRKHFATPSALPPGGVATLTFDGVYMHSEIWLNGVHVRSQPYGYSTFMVEITPHLRADGGANVLAVRVANTGRNSRWYSGSGIYRHVRLTLQPAVHLPAWGVALSTPEVGRDAATVRVAATVANRAADAAQLAVRVRLLDPTGREAARAAVAQRVPARGEATAALELTVAKPRLWAPESPSLYQAEVSVFDAATAIVEAAGEAAAAAAKAEAAAAATAIDVANETFGIRSLSWGAAEGLQLNGAPIELRGGCVHHDNGPLGSATVERAEVRRVELLKANGYNAIRTSHNPVSPAFLAACDRLGMLVMDEAFDCWSGGKNPDDYHLYFDEWWRRDLEAMVLRDRNHPSVIMWSIGNEIPVRASPLGYNLSAQLAAFVRARDPAGRPVTSAYPGVSDKADDFFAPLDVAGYNYSPERYESDHARVPGRVMVATESFPADSYDYWQGVWQHSWVVGDFIWTALDYIGESAIGNAAYATDADPLGACFSDTAWSWHTSYCGDLDICGFKKPQSNYRNVLWRLSPLELVTHDPIPAGATERVSAWGWPNEEVSWTWPGEEGTPLTVKAYTWHENVTLLLNGAVVGHAGVDKLTASFTLPYAPGNLTAVAWSAADAAQPAAVHTLLTAGVPAALRATADRDPICATPDDLAYVTVEVVDASGRVVPRAQLPLEFSLQGGAAEIYRVGNGDPRDLGSFTAPRRTTFRGRALCVLRPTATRKAGQAVLSVKTPGLPAASIVVRVASDACA